MSFSDTDPLEEQMAIRCEDMSADQLVTYLKDWQEAFHNVVLKLDGKEVWIMRWLQKVYGSDAGLIVKWVCYRHHGKLRGEIITHRSFNTKMKWWIDKMHVEAQQQLARDSRTQEDTPEGSTSRFATSL